MDDDARARNRRRCRGRGDRGAVRRLRGVVTRQADGGRPEDARAPAAERTFANPILPGMYPDPASAASAPTSTWSPAASNISRASRSSTAATWCSWTQIGHVLTRERQLNLAGVYSSGGIYAPTLRHHAGRFYMITTLVGSPKRGGNFYVTADDPRGPWSDPIWLDTASTVASIRRCCSRTARRTTCATARAPTQRSPARLPGAHRSGDGRAARADAGRSGKGPAASGPRARTSTR